MCIYRLNALYVPHYHNKTDICTCEKGLRIISHQSLNFNHVWIRVIMLVVFIVTHVTIGQDTVSRDMIKSVHNEIGIH